MAEAAGAPRSAEGAAQVVLAGLRHVRRSAHLAHSSAHTLGIGFRRSGQGEALLLRSGNRSHHRIRRLAPLARRNWDNSSNLTYLRRIVVLSLIALRSDSVRTLVVAASIPSLSRVTASSAVLLDLSTV